MAEVSPNTPPETGLSSFRRLIERGRNDGRSRYSPSLSGSFVGAGDGSQRKTEVSEVTILAIHPSRPLGFSLEAGEVGGPRPQQAGAGPQPSRCVPRAHEHGDQLSGDKELTRQHCQQLPRSLYDSR